MRLVPVLLTVLMTIPALAHAFDGGAMGNGFQVDGFEDSNKRIESSHVGYCMSRIDQEARKRNVRVSEMIGTTIPQVGGTVVAGAIATLEDGTRCECAWNNPVLSCF